MNRNPDGTLLTVEQLENMARTVGISAKEIEQQHAIHEKAAMWRSWLLMATRHLRFEMMAKGQLVLRTEVWKASPPKPVTVESWALAQKGLGS